VYDGEAEDARFSLLGKAGTQKLGATVCAAGPWRLVFAGWENGGWSRSGHRFSKIV
jgi:hypothetical protein